LPGVGSFGHAIEQLINLNLYNPIIELITNGQPFLAICIGLQLCFESSEESPGVKGLSVFKGKVKKFVSDKSLSIPQIGWNNVEIKNDTFKDFDNKYFYFVHSFYVEPKDTSIVLSTTDYGIEYVSSVIKDNIIATQFHPEKSGKDGLAFLEKVMAYFKI
ncbi:MAG: imidazole glycerol phosphate synthase, glutamine amidotransferase subunit, partial [Candidatus Margulisbacteria bacterium GWF2_35_9]